MATADLIKIEYKLEETFDSDPPLKFYYRLAQKKSDYIERHMQEVAGDLEVVESIIERTQMDAKYQYKLIFFLDRKEEAETLA